MKRIFPVAMILTACGALFWIADTVSAKTAGLEAQLLDKDSTITALKNTVSEATLRAEYLEKENARLADLVKRLEDAPTFTSTETEAPAPVSFTEELPATDTQPSELTETAEDMERREDRRRQFGREMENRRSEWMAYMDERWENADPATQERISSMVEHQNVLMDLRDQMRATESEEERDELQMAMQETVAIMRQISTEQQNTMLDHVAASYGIEDAKERAGFSQAVRQVISDPLFQMGGGAGRGGFGGSGRRGGGRN